jgi:hypothetical protein
VFARHSVPTALVAMSFIVAALLLPTALRPPPDTANASGALNPNAPPQQDNVQFLEASQEAAGGGAGSAGGGANGGTTTTTQAPPVANPQAETRPPSLGYCYGNPPRQIPSVYSGPCVGAGHGDNGGSTWKNVFPNEIRIDIQGTGAPPTGRLKDASQNDASTSGDTRTWQALEEYFNRHFQFYNRRVKFYGLAKPADDSAASNEASATIAADQDQAFLMHNTIVGVCEPFVRKSLVAVCDPLSRADNAAYAPGMFSPFMDLDEGIGFGSEFACKTLVGGNTKFGGADQNGKPRKFGYIGYLSSKGGIDAQKFKDAFAHECNGDVEVATMSSDADAQGAAAAITRFHADGVTTIIFYNQYTNVAVGMQQADNLAYNPEWVMVGAYAVDSNIVGEILPAHQAAHLFGLSTSQEWPKRNETRECFQAVREIDPSLSASTGICNQWWMQLVTQMSGLQGAGPHLTPQTFEKGMFGLGHRFGQSNWNLGGGFGPGDKGYTDDVAIVWWSSTAPDIVDNSVGAYVWTHGGHRFQRGQLPVGDSELFTAGSSAAPES